MKKLLLLLIFPLFLGGTSKYQYKYEMPFAPVIYQGINDSIPTIDQFGRIRNGIIAQRIIDTMNNDPSGVDLTRAEQDYVRSIVGGLYVTGMWQRTTAMYPMVGGNAWKHKWNWKDMRDLDAAFRLVFNGTVVHNNLGFSGGGNALNYANTFLTPSTSLINENVHLSAYYTSVGTNSVSVGAISGLNILAIDAGGFAYISNSTLFDKIGFTPNGNSIKYVIESYKDSFFNILINGIAATKTTQESIGSSLPNVPIFIGVLNGSGQNSTRKHGFVSIGSGLTDQIAIPSSQVITYSQGILNRQ